MKHHRLASLPLLLSSLSWAQPFCVSPNASIPDDNPGGVQIPIAVDLAAGARVTSITLDLDLAHQWVGDLVVSLISPGGVTAVLIDRPGIPSTGFPGPFGCGGPNVLATIADVAPVPVETVCSLVADPVIAGVVSPNEPLSVFMGELAQGTWTLDVSDRSVFDTGVVASACLNISAELPCTPDLAEPLGELNFFDISAFIGLFNSGDAAADFAEPFGVLNFFDVAEYIALYGAGCP
ncbi:MAG: proprotein convertase P-domain-containing protein [Planctomycetota bacterium]